MRRRSRSGARCSTGARWRWRRRGRWAWTGWRRRCARPAWTPRSSRRRCSTRWCASDRRRWRRWRGCWWAARRCRRRTWPSTSGWRAWPSSTTCTDRPRRPRSAPGSGSLPRTRAASGCRSAGRSPTAPRTGWGGGGGRGGGWGGRGALPAERFVADPYGAPGSRLYRTGDLVRQRADGALEFLGRLDGQVKIRGFRVELAEIEEVLRTGPGVGDAAAQVWVREAGQKQLVGYVVPADDTGAFDEAALRQHLGERLPEYMVPSVFVAVTRLPLNANGKVDRNALPRPEDVASARSPRLAPRTPTETALVAIWQHVLQVAEIGATDNYFEVGGDSILSLQIVAQAQAQGLAFELEDLFELETIEALAAAIDGAET